LHEMSSIGSRDEACGRTQTKKLMGDSRVLRE
jgi:hypothetical protein